MYTSFEKVGIPGKATPSVSDKKEDLPPKNTIPIPDISALLILGFPLSMLLMQLKHQPYFSKSFILSNYNFHSRLSKL